MMKPHKALFKNLAIVVLLSCLAAPQMTYANDEYTLEEINEEYPPPFRTDFNTEIVKVLVKNEVRGCGIIKYRISNRPQDKEYLVLCSNDNENWKAYWLWVYTGKVIGPMQPIPGLE